MCITPGIIANIRAASAAEHIAHVDSINKQLRGLSADDYERFAELRAERDIRIELFIEKQQQYEQERMD